MKIRRLSENQLEACSDFWWSLYKDRPYVHRPDGFQTLNTTPVGPGYFSDHLGYALSSGEYSSNWAGDVSCDSVLLAEDKGIKGILVAAIDNQDMSGKILSAYTTRDAVGSEVARSLLMEALEYFRSLGIQRAIAAPGLGASMEVESPIHLALLEEGFAWEDDWEPAYPARSYEVFLGGSLEGFELQPAIKEKIDQLGNEGIEIKRVEKSETPRLVRLDTGTDVDPFSNSHCGFVAAVDGLVVGWTFEVSVFEDAQRTLCQVGPEVISRYRRKGIGKVLQHLGTEEAVRCGAQGGWTATGVYNPARIIYQSVGWRYWYTSFGRISMILA